MSSFLGVFSSPLLLALLPLATLFLVYIYRRRGSSPRVLASSLFILKALKSLPRSRAKFNPPFRFFFELLLFALLIGAAADLLWPQHTKSILIVMDNSPSMLTSEPSTENDRFREAKKSAAELLHSLNDSNFVTLYELSPSPRKLIENAAPSEVLAELKSLNIAFEESSNEIVSSIPISGFDGAHIFTDRDISKAPDIWVQHQITTGASKPNIAIVDAAYSGNEVVVTLRNYSREALTVNVELLSIETIGQKILAKSEVELLAKKDRQVSFSNIDAANLAVKIKDSDALAFDNIYFLSKNLSHGKELLIVGDKSKTSKLNLNAISGYNFKYASPGDEELQAELPRIYYRSSSAKLPSVNSAFILPPLENAVFPALETVKKPLISRWNALHPLTRYINFSALNPSEAMVFQEAAFSDSLIKVSAGPIMGTKRESGLKFVGFGIDLFPYEGKKSPISSVLTINLFNWLLDSSINTGALPKSALRLYSERFEEIPSDARLSPGFYESKTSANFIRNFISDVESDTYSSSPLELPAKTQRIAQADKTPKSIRHEILIALIILFILDLAFLLLRRRSRVSS